MTESAADLAAPTSKPPVSAADREARRRRVFGLVQRGWSHDEIAEAEGLTPQKVREIVGQTLARRAIEPSLDHRRLQMARLDPALRLAAEKVAQGDLRAVDRLIRVLERLDKYQTVAFSAWEEEEDDAAKFDAKIADLRRRAEEKAAAQQAACNLAADDDDDFGDSAGSWEPGGDEV